MLFRRMVSAGPDGLMRSEPGAPPDLGASKALQLRLTRWHGRLTFGAGQDPYSPCYPGAARGPTPAALRASLTALPPIRTWSRLAGTGRVASAFRGAGWALGQ